MLPRSSNFLWSLLMGAMTIFSSCEKIMDKPNGGTLDQPLFLHVDSACIQLPNVFTPNGDGINDILVALGNYVNGAHMEVRTLSGYLIWQGSGGWPGWDGRKDGLLLPDHAYRVTISGTSLSGHGLKGSTRVVLTSDPTRTCFSSHQIPITGDMFDPRQCAPIYFSNDLFCTAP